MAATGSPDWRNANSMFWPLAALMLLAALQFSLIFTRAINWDEFSFYREVAVFAQGTLERPLQTIHVRLFAWLPGLFDIVIDHIIAARAVMMLCELATLVSLFLIARRFADVRAALFCPLLYLSAGFVMQHGFAFRVDAMAAALACAALAVLVNSRLNWLGIAVFGLLTGLAAMVTIKVALYAPAFAGLAFWRASSHGWDRAQVLRLAACGVAAVGACAALYSWHAAGLAPATGGATSSAVQVGNAGGYAFFFGVPIYWQFALKAAATAPVLAAMIVAAPVTLWRSSRNVAEKVALAGLWLPITSVFFYTNTLAYFYAFILPPLAISVVLAVQWVLARYNARLLAVLLAVMAGGMWLVEDRAMIDRQRQLDRNVHGLFAQPVTYFDHNYMLGDWPKGNGFLTRWGLDIYRKEGQPAYVEAMRRDTIPLFLANYPELESMIRGEADGLLLAEDEAALRANYVEFSWPLWVAGKDFRGRRSSFAETFMVPGPYTVEAAPISIDGRSYQPGEVVQIARGSHQIALAGGGARLVWGDHLPLPETPLEPGPLYVLF